MITSFLQDRIRQTEILNRLTIAKQAKELEQREKYKSQFLSNITHELKTPLSIIIGNSDLMMDQVAQLNREMLPQLSTIQQSAFQLSNHVDRIVSVSSMDSAEETIQMDNYNYNGIVKNVCALFKNKAQFEKIKFQWNTPSQPLVVRGDIIRIEEVLRNLIQNAFKFTEGGGEVTVNVTNNATNVYTEVIDTGVGIPIDKIDRVFDRLVQVDDVLSKRHGGIGLGLYICKRNVEQLGGSISVTSRVGGQGTTFRFSLPLFLDQEAEYKNVSYKKDERRKTDRRGRVDRRLKDRRQMADRREGERSRLFEYQQNLEIDSYAQMAIFTNIDDYENQRPGSSGILIAEDNPGMMGVVVDALKDEFNLILAKDGLEAWDKLKRHRDKISLILADVMMPNLDGFSFCRRMMSDTKYRHLPFIFVTALMSEEEQLKGLNLGATDYITKPYNVKILKEKVRHWISQRQYESLMHNLARNYERKATEASKLRNIIVHEIRNPLQIINSADYYVRKLHETLYEKSSEHEKSWWEGTKDMHVGVDTIKSVLESSKEMENITLRDKKPLVLKQLIQDATAETAHLTNGINVETKFLKISPEVQIECDRRLMIQVLVNIIRNGVEAIKEKQSAEKGNLNIVCSQVHSGQVKLDIADNGVGMEPKALRNLFRYKYTTKKEGTGVGLYFSKVILKLHEGNIKAQTSPGIGTTFTLNLPLFLREQKEKKEKAV